MFNWNNKSADVRVWPAQSIAIYRYGKRYMDFETEAKQFSYIRYKQST